MSMQEKQYVDAHIEAKTLDTGLTVIASTENVDRDGEVIKLSGWDLENFRKNPVLLWSHNPSLPPIGRAKNIRIEGGALVFEPEFAEEQSEFAGEIGRLVKDRFINTTSVGFIPRERNGNTIEEAELLEISFVGIPANADAQVLRSFKSMQEKFEKVEEKGEKIGRVLSESTKAKIKNAKDSLIDASQALEDLLNIDLDKSQDESTSEVKVEKRTPMVKNRVRLAARALNLALEEMKK